MTRLRLTIAKRLKEAQENAAMLTTFNEVDMSEVIAMRNQYKDEFQKNYGVKLGFMSFFVKSCVIGLKNYPYYIFKNSLFGCSRDSFTIFKNETASFPSIIL